MKTIKILFVFMLFIIASCTNIIVKNVKNYDGISFNKHLLNYYLPKRQIEVMITLEHQVTNPSMFIKDSTILNPLIEEATGKRMAKKREQKFVVKSVELKPISVPDPEKLYSIDYRKCFLSKLEGNVSITENGLIQNGTVSQESKAYQVIQTGVESIAGIISSFVGFKKGSEKLNIISTVDKPEVIKAKELIDKIFDIQKSKAALIVNPMNIDPKLFEMKLAILKEQEDEIIQQLTGEVSKKEYILSRIWEPKSRDISNGEINYTIDININNKDSNKSKEKKISIILNATVDANLFNQLKSDLYQKKVEKYVGDNEKKIGFYYNIPIPTIIRVYKNSITDINQLNFVVNSNKESSITLQIPQFGLVGFLPARLKKSDVKFYSDLGSIKEFSFIKDVSLMPEEVKNIASSLDTVFSTISYLKNLEKSEIETVTTDGESLYNINISISPAEEK
ncbi:MAG: DUF4831 family protein [Bacteroidales bacterium]|nr:MAG: DUF4831 family protein [Bacteroidales bacterium]